MSQFVRSASLTNYADVARTAGLDPWQMLKAVGLPRQCLSNPDLKIARNAVRQLLENSAAASGIQSFGLQMAETRRLSNLGPIGLVFREEPTLRSALDAVSRYIRFQNEALITTMEVSEGIVIFRANTRGTRPSRQSTELIAGVILRLWRIFLGKNWNPLRVCFMHQAPQDLSVHRRIFGNCVAFGEDFNGLVCNAEDLDVMNPSWDPVMARYARQFLESTYHSASPGTTDEVRQLLFALLPSGQCTIDHVARHLCMTRRTIHRHLAQDGESFYSVLNALRSELATRYITDTDRPLSEVAELLGFSALSAFSRWYRGQFGCSAMQSRAGISASGLF